MKRYLIITCLILLLLLTFSAVSADISANRFLSLVSETKAKDTAPSGGDADLYDKAYDLYRNKKYFKAHEFFIESQYGDWETMAKKCVRRWPKNGEVWHDNTQWLRDTQVTFKVEQPKTSAIFLRIYKDGKPVSYVFIGGSDEITVGLPGNGKYTIKDGVGSEWYEMTDTFGEYGAYETMTFGEFDDDFIYLEARYHYTITINIENIDGEDIGSAAEVWENFTK